MIQHNVTLDPLFELLDRAVTLPYYKQALPSPVDEDLFRMLLKLTSCGREEWELIKQAIPANVSGIFGLFAERMASLAVRESAEDRAKVGLLGLVLYAVNADERDALVVMSVLHDAVLRIRKDPLVIFAGIRSQFGPVSFLENYLLRRPESQSIEAMGYEITSEAGGFQYRRTW